MPVDPTKLRSDVEDLIVAHDAHIAARADNDAAKNDVLDAKAKQLSKQDGEDAAAAEEQGKLDALLADAQEFETAATPVPPV